MLFYLISHYARSVTNEHHCSFTMRYCMNFYLRALFISFKLGVLIALLAYNFLTVGACPSIYKVDLEKLGVLEHTKHPR